MKPPFDYAAALGWLEGHYNLERTPGGTHPPTDRPSLDRMAALADLLDNPQRAVDAIHVTGTNGKGSTTAIAVELLGATGLAAGSFTSPHITAPNDRIAVANRPLTDAEFAQAISQVAVVEPLLVERFGERATYFEVLTAAAYCHFADVAHANVIEVGMGGRFDATNVVDAQVAVITNVAADHLEVIGPSLADVATEKAGIFSPGATAVVGVTDPELGEVIANEATSASVERLLVAGRDFGVTRRAPALGGQVVTLRTPATTYDDVFLSLYGAHQANNAALALAATEAFLAEPLKPPIVDEALGAVAVPGRFERVRAAPAVVCDTAHNPAGASAAAATFDETFAQVEPAVLVLGVSHPHDAAAMTAALGPTRWHRVIATAADWTRSVPAEEVAAGVRRAGVDPARVTVAPHVDEAVDAALSACGTAGAALVTGSTYVVAEARPHLALSISAPHQRHGVGARQKSQPSAPVA